MLDPYNSLPQLDNHIQCPSLFGKNEKKAIINISPKYYDFKFCNCLSGYYDANLNTSGKYIGI